MTVHERLEEVFRMIFGDDDISLRPDTTADDIDGWDSTAHVTLMFAIEDEFGVQFSESQLVDFASIGELEAFLEANSESS